MCRICAALAKGSTMARLLHIENAAGARRDRSRSAQGDIFDWPILGFG